MKLFLLALLVAFVAAEPEADSDAYLYSRFGYTGYSGLYNRAYGLGYSGIYSPYRSIYNYGYYKRDAEADSEADPWTVYGAYNRFGSFGSYYPRTYGSYIRPYSTYGSVYNRFLYKREAEAEPYTISQVTGLHPYSYLPRTISTHYPSTYYGYSNLHYNRFLYKREAEADAEPEPYTISQVTGLHPYSYLPRTVSTHYPYRAGFYGNIYNRGFYY